MNFIAWIHFKKCDNTFWQTILGIKKENGPKPKRMEKYPAMIYSLLLKI